MVLTAGFGGLRLPPQFFIKPVEPMTKNPDNSVGAGIFDRMSLTGKPNSETLLMLIVLIGIAIFLFKR